MIRGDGHWRVDGELVAVREGSFIRFDPGTTRCPVAGPEGMAFISVGSPARGLRPARPVLNRVPRPRGSPPGTRSATRS